MVETDSDRRMDLNLDLGVYCLPKPLSEFLHEVSLIKDCPSTLSEIGGLVDRLEEERRKIDAFKRELPLCMLLLNEAIGRLKKGATRSAEKRDGSAREGSVASIRKFDDGGGAKVENDKKNWMSSAQLWISNSDSQLQSRNEEDEEEEEEEEDRSLTQNPFPNCNFANNGGAFLPFMRPCGSYHPSPPPLTLMTPASDTVVNCRVDRRQLSKTLSQQQKKEQRRRWSPELHRKFIDALQLLGGSQAATPKQIRELMQVEGLTNDEVKSHLQKYRIHVRKHPKTIFAAAETAKTTGGSGRIQCKGSDLESRGISHSQSDSPQGPLARRGASSNGGHSSEAAEGEDDEEAKSDGQSCKNASNAEELVHLQL
ncbi:PREDICTED: myb family transcription factor EFM [Tarenaya hassleriana]|uniref:myb family transcription factor EFM n=1 Tax=Tarenaya hassleriana TaxID=28532 RepID=UPI00053C164B|nr:PREDICTED: myb family transcription factor EFM [Tarenaya hassleriana]